MNDRRDAPVSISDDGFDRALRAIHSDAVSNVSVRTQAQLRQRLRSATLPAQAPRHGWQMASALVALVLVAGVYWRATSLPNAPSPAAIANTHADNGDLVAVIDETPDLYLWLDSDEATRLASE